MHFYCVDNKKEIMRLKNVNLEIRMTAKMQWKEHADEYPGGDGGGSHERVPRSPNPAHALDRRIRSTFTVLHKNGMVLRKEGVGMECGGWECGGVL